MKTTYEKIKSFCPCSDGWKKLLENTNPEMDMEKEIELIDILKSNGIKDAVWALRCFDYLDYCLFLADVAESTLPIFEKKYPDDDRPRKAIQAIRDYKENKIEKDEFAASYAAAAADAADAAADAAYAADAADAADADANTTRKEHRDWCRARLREYLSGERPLAAAKETP